MSDEQRNGRIGQDCRGRNALGLGISRTMGGLVSKAEPTAKKFPGLSQDFHNGNTAERRAEED